MILFPSRAASCIANFEGSSILDLILDPVLINVWSEREINEGEQT